MGSCADAVSGKKARQNPMGFLCKFQVLFETHHRTATFATHVLFRGIWRQVLPLASKIQVCGVSQNPWTRASVLP